MHLRIVGRPSRWMAKPPLPSCATTCAIPLVGGGFPHPMPARAQPQTLMTVMIPTAATPRPGFLTFAGKTASPPSDHLVRHGCWPWRLSMKDFVVAEGTSLCRSSSLLFAPRLSSVSTGLTSGHFHRSNGIQFGLRTPLRQHSTRAPQQAQPPARRVSSPMPLTLIQD